MNFSYLENQPELSALQGCCAECEAFAHSRPDISITAARKAVEYMVKLLYGTRISPHIQGLTMFDMLSDYDFADCLGSRELLDAIHLIRRKGNRAVHEGNMTEQDALSVLERLHYVTGEVCVKLGFITGYPPFDPELQPADPAGKVPSSGEPQVDEALLERLTQRLRRHMRAPGAAGEARITDVHVSPVLDAQKISRREIAVGTDSGANGRAAHRYLSGYLAQTLPDVQILMEPRKSELILIRNGKETVLAIKTGCTVLGTKDPEGQWQLLEGVDYVLYAPDVLPDIPPEKQFRLFGRDAFLKFWEELGLLRFKISTAMRKKLLQQLGPEAKLPTGEYADVVSIQSFTNSGRKLPLVTQGLTHYPLLSDTDLPPLL